MYILPESPVRQHVPLWKIAGPHAGKLKPGPAWGPVFFMCHKLFEARDGVGEIGDLRLGDRRQHLGHDAVVAVPHIGFVLA